MEKNDNVNEILPHAPILSLVDYIGDNDKAITEYNEATQLNPNNADVYKYRGIAYFNKGDYDQAIADFSQIIEIKTSNEIKNTAYYNRGTTYINKGRNDLAIKDFNIIIDYNQNDIYALYNRGVAYYKTGNLAKAIADWEAVKRIDPYYENVKQKLEIVRGKIDSN